VRRQIDPPGQAADDGPAARGQTAGQGGCVGAGGRRRLACADDADRQIIGREQRAPAEEQRRRVAQAVQQRWIAQIRVGQQGDARRFPGSNGGGGQRDVDRFDGGGQARADARHGLQRRRAGSVDRLNVAEAVEQVTQGDAADAGDQAQADQKS